MLIRRLIVFFLKKARLACSLTYPTFLPFRSRSRSRLLRCYAVPTSVTFLPIVITYSRYNVRRPRAGCSRPGVTVSGAPAKLLPTA
ncbi:hypothetical protein L249_1073 [Ophiocordyceps polyrhachis-furcata BCC 54312]|uniref:Uncharacterized protein n=1 Tax=Ophiocordyceps polyrhachis-furcata BCC 54312 TaxID=1330021 RepID=A0A367LC54_9HYPO|nr:hypothetical protein L249_1073 [Ophiocordyceps polyrhachis-furcata BCC 54312]